MMRLVAAELGECRESYVQTVLKSGHLYTSHRVTHIINAKADS